MPRAPLRILIVDDEPAARAALKALLESEGHRVEQAADGAAALESQKAVPVDLVISDIDMPNMDGMHLLRALRSLDLTLPVIVLTSTTELRSAVTAMHAGASDYLTKPLDFDALKLSIARAIERRNVRIENENLLRQLKETRSEAMQGLLGTSAAMQHVYRLARQVAPSRATVLITGESGTGKGELARAIHARNPYPDKPFVAVHCASLAETLLESELFGHEKGAFTGADRLRIGRVEQANGGTLFLDEVGEISLATQVRLLTVLQERTFERVGGNEPIKVDVRILAATNRDLRAEVNARRFREDLYYRLNVVHIEMPPLHRRGADISVLADHFLRRFARENDKPIEGFSERARTKLRNHVWPGNVRELENAIERAVVLCDGALIGEEHFPGDPLESGFDGPPIPGTTLAELEKFAILRTLDAVDGSTARAAEMLDVSVRTIQYRMRQYGVSRDRARLLSNPSED